MGSSASETNGSWLAEYPSTMLSAKCDVCASTDDTWKSLKYVST